jgi:hypothetical protein
VYERCKIGLKRKRSLRTITATTQNVERAASVNKGFERHQPVYSSELKKKKSGGNGVLTQPEDHHC